MPSCLVLKASVYLDYDRLIAAVKAILGGVQRAQLTGTVPLG